jgi:hypothetical protein
VKLTLTYQGFYLRPDDESWAMLKDECKPGQIIVVEAKEWRTRTGQQNKAIHVYCAELAQALNGAGLDMRAVLAAMKQGVEIPWTLDLIKETIWRQIQNAMIDKASTTRLTPEQVSKVYEVCNRFTAERFGISMPFPSRFNE